jgi:NAD(P)-dependent dehydrogenase (short-subunit alcohol dehydrogenase family)
MRLKSRVAIITGAARGIGREIARRFAAEGAAVAVADVNHDGAAAVAAEIGKAGGDALAVAVDITVPAQVEALTRATLDRFGRLDVLVNNAGVGLNRPFLATTLEDWERVLRVNLTGTFVCAQAAARVMVDQGSGTIVNIGSISGQRGGQGRCAYGASKAGILLLTKVMAVELAPHGVTVNAIAPGPVVTDMSNGTHTEATRKSYHDRIPLRRYGREAEIAAAALFLASAEASFVTGHTLNVDGGFNAAGLLFDPEDNGNGACHPVRREAVRAEGRR